MAAGLGFKTFNTGDVLSAADVNGYLMQGVLVFANAAARDAAITSPQEGQCCYLKDTDAVQTYSGTAWVGFDDSNAIQNSLVDAKGDIVAASGNDTPARLAVGNNGETLVADSSTATGLAYTPTFFAGKNKIINGDFYVNQRNFSSTTTSGTFMFDRWSNYLADGTVTYSAQTFTPGTAPVAGYEGKNFIRCVTTGQTLTSAAAILIQNIEDVRTLAGQTATISFWAKAGSGTPKVGIEAYQFFGTGGSPSAFVSTPVGTVTLTTSWARYSVTVAIPSISGKTLGTTNNSLLALNLWTSAGSTFATRASSIGIQSATIDIWGVQVEAGSVATAFQTATGTLQGELAACQRYYWRNTAAQFSTILPFGIQSTSATTFVGIIQNPVPMRVAATAIDYSGTYYAQRIIAGVDKLVTSYTIAASTPLLSAFTGVAATGLTNGYLGYIAANANNEYVGFSAEL